MKSEILAKIVFVFVFVLFWATATFFPENQNYLGLFLTTAAAMAVFFHKKSRITAPEITIFACSSAFFLAPLFLNPPAVFFVILVSAVSVFVSLRKIAATQRRTTGQSQPLC